MAPKKAQQKIEESEEETSSEEEEQPNNFASKAKEKAAATAKRQGDSEQSEKAKGKTKAKAANAKDESSEEEGSSEDDAPKAKAKAKRRTKAKVKVESSEEESSSEEDAPKAKAKVKGKANAKAKLGSSEEESSSEEGEARNPKANVVRPAKANAKDEPEEDSSSEDDTPAARAKAKGEAKAKAKGKSRSQSEEETEDDTKAPLNLDQNSDSEDECEEEKPPPNREDSKKAEPAKAVNVMAMFGDKKDKGGDEQKNKKARKDKTDKEEKKDKKDKKERKEKKGKEREKPVPCVCEVSRVTPVPKKGELRLCKVLFGKGGRIVDVVTDVVNVQACRKYIIALPGVTTANGVEVTQAKVGGVESFGMFCGPEEMGWATDVLPKDEVVQVADESEVGALAPSYEVACEVFEERQKVLAEKAEDEVAKRKTPVGKDKKDARKKDDEDFDALLVEFGVEIKDPVVSGKKRKAKAADKKKEGDSFNAILAEVTAKPAQIPAPLVAAEPATEALDVAASSTALVVAASKEDDVDESQLDAKTWANRRKKEKKKANAAKAVGGAGLFGGSGSDAASPTSPDGGVSSRSRGDAVAKAKGKAKSESAAIKKRREEIETLKALKAQQEADVAKQKQEIAEEEARLEEEARIQKEQREARVAARAAKIVAQKADGTYQTKKQKQLAERAKMLREQFGFVHGADWDGERVVVAEKKKKQRKQTTEERMVAEAAALTRTEETKEERKGETPTAAEEEDGDDDWEKVAEGEKTDVANKSKDDEEDNEGDDEEGSDSDEKSEFAGLRSPILVIMGHVDTGKTKLLDKIRRTNVQEGEAGGITQQIGATFFPDIALKEQTDKCDTHFDMEVPGIMVIDTPGHESFNNLRVRGSSLCDMAILVVDIMGGLENQTIESLELLKKRKCFFVIALNKVDSLYQWYSKPYTSIQDALARQEPCVLDEFHKRLNWVKLKLNEQGLNCELYWENDDPGSTVSIIPTSALTGEGVPDLLYVAIKRAQEVMPDRLEIREELECTVIEVKNIEGLGTTIDVVLVNGMLREGDQIVMAGMSGAIVTTIRALLTPQPMNEMRVKNEYVHHSQISTSMGVKICAPGLENAIAGSELLVVGPGDNVEDLKEQLNEGDSFVGDYEMATEGVYVKASTLGSLEALLCFLQEIKIPVFAVGIGEVHKKDVRKACIMKEKKKPEYGVILAFDVTVNKEAKAQAEHDDVQIFCADIIYNLQDKFKAYIEKFNAKMKQETASQAVFPVIMQIEQRFVFHKADPIIVGCNILAGRLHIGTPICLPDKNFFEIGRVSSIKKDSKPAKTARTGEQVCIKIEQNTAQKHIAYGRHFDADCKLYSSISRQSIDTLKAHFKDEMTKEDWHLIMNMKPLFKIQ